MRFSLLRDWVMPEYQPIEKNEKIAKRAIFDLATFSEWAHKSLLIIPLILISLSALAQKHKVADNIPFDDTRKTHWPADFLKVDIPSSVDTVEQRAFFLRARSDQPGPLIVSLHTWSGDYQQKDPLATLCQEQDLNYIHPNFRGRNNSVQACCSELALSDIDDAIDYALQHAKVDPELIHVVGVSGGGYATLSTFMKSKHQIRTFSAWASISDLAAWHHESDIRENKYAQDILDCTASTVKLDREEALRRSPLHMKTPVRKLTESKLLIYTGIYDGIRGSVPITHSINMYNKILQDLNVEDVRKYVSNSEKLALLEDRRPLGDFGMISDRRVFLKKEHGNVRLLIFDGGHEMLSEYALDELLRE